MSTHFPRHLNEHELSHLRKNMKIDHRDISGRFILATVIDKSGGIVRIHYDGWSKRWDVSLNYHNKQEFAEAESISRRPAHRLKNLKVGDYIDVNTQGTVGWVKGQIRRFDGHSGQIQVRVNDNQVETSARLHWVHLDNVNEVDPLCEWLQARHCLSDMPFLLKSECGTEIIENVFGGMSNVIDFFIANATALQLRQMRQVMQQKMIKFNKEARNKKKENKLNNINDDRNPKQKPKPKPKISSITELSKDAIGHICGYLNREDIKSFKFTSCKIGVICLKEMKKYEVGVFNTNEMIDDTDELYVDSIQFNCSELAHCSRYVASTRFSDLCEEWEKNYSIPLRGL